MVGPLYAMSPMQVETPSSTQEPPSTTTQVLSDFRPGENLDSEPLSRNGSLAENIIQESVFWKMPQADGNRLTQVEACELPMRQAVKGKAYIAALAGDPVNPPECFQTGNGTAAVAGDGAPAPAPGAGGGGGRRPRARVVQVKKPLENQDFKIMGIGIKVNDEMMTTKGVWDHPRVVCLVVPNLNLDS